jgi:glutamate dehydrogenase
MLSQPDDRIAPILELFYTTHPGLSTVQRAFAEKLLRHISAPDWQTLAPEDILALIEGFWDHASVRLVSTPRLRVFTRTLHQSDTLRTVVQMVNDDMPFLLDSTLALLRRYNLTPHFVLHPVVRVERDTQGVLTGIGGPHAIDQFIYESFIHIELEQVLNLEEQQKLVDELKYLLAEVRHAVTSWDIMRNKSLEIVDRLDDFAHEESDFVRWLTQDNFTFLGYRCYHHPGGGMQLAQAVGIDHSVHYPVGLALDAHKLLDSKKTLSINKSHLVSMVHKAELIDLVEICIATDHGKEVHQFLGLFTSASYDRPVKEIPVLRLKRQNIFERSGLQPQWHDGKLLTYFLNNFPRHSFFHLTEDEVLHFSATILGIQERGYSHILTHFDDTGQVLSCVLYILKQDYSESLRASLTHILERRLQGKVATSYLRVGDEAYAWLHFHVTVKSKLDASIDLEDVEQELLQAIRPWDAKLRQRLMSAYGQIKGGRLAKAFEGSFDSIYQRSFSLDQAMMDIATIEAMLAKDEPAAAFAMTQGKRPDALRLRVFHTSTPIALSTLLPVIENLGLQVLNEDSVVIEMHNHKLPIYLQVLDTLTDNRQPIDVEDVGARLVDCLERVWANSTDNDGFNKLIIKANLRTEQVQVMRAYARYMRQIPVPFSQESIENTLVNHADITQKLLELFHQRFAPDQPKLAKSLVVALKRRISTVSSTDEERILELYLKLIMSTVRTNFYQMSADGSKKSYISFKLDARKIEELPLPRPQIEVFVYSRGMEGVHLRGGLVARGGIRHSDRKEDFRTEILGLVKAQNPKNAVIVPVGAKGGFIVKGPETREEVVRAYQTLIRGLLDLTDNLLDGQIIPPLNTKCYDGQDPYLVVAADKGTATFSDVANELATAYGFWLGDAFASGGSYGYDHKKIGITARGAWQSLRRHLYAIGVGEEQLLTMVGVGDMSGDVFGNGMLQSDRLLLIGAFNHQHIFVDPNPDPQLSFNERQRLFALPRSTWADYDLSQASTGARVYNRTDKELALTPEIQARFGIAGATLTPNDLIRHLLLAAVDVLWFGGIGTYVKAAVETHAEVGDRANEMVRVDGNQLRTRIVVEGANLGCTQRGRMEYALKGGMITTDFVDNVGGVNCSDHEVNIKILLNQLVQKHALTPLKRNDLLVTMTDTVAKLVLKDSEQQVLGLQVSAYQASCLWQYHQALILYLEQEGRLDRVLEYLPDDAALHQRSIGGEIRAGLTMPEIAILTAVTKNTVRAALLGVETLPDSLVEGDFINYFPPHLLQFKDELMAHQLRAEITATVIANMVVNRLGATFMVQLVEDFPGMPLADYVMAFLEVRHAWNLDEVWANIENITVPFEAQMQIFEELRHLILQACAVLLRHRHTLSLGDVVQLKNILSCAEEVESCVLPERYQPRFNHDALPTQLATELRSIARQMDLLDVALMAQKHSVHIDTMMTLSQDLGERLGFQWMRQQLKEVPMTTVWHKQHARDLETQLRDVYEQILQILLSHGDTLDNWLAQQGEPWYNYQQMLSKLKNTPRIDLSMLAVLVRELGLIVNKKLVKET